MQFFLYGDWAQAMVFTFFFVYFNLISIFLAIIHFTLKLSVIYH